MLGISIWIPDEVFAYAESLEEPKRFTEFGCSLICRTICYSKQYFFGSTYVPEVIERLRHSKFISCCGASPGQS